MESGDVINMTRYVSSPYIIHQSTIGEKVKLYNDYSKRYHLLTEEEIRILLQCKNRCHTMSYAPTFKVN